MNFSIQIMNILALFWLISAIKKLLIAYKQICIKLKFNRKIFFFEAYIDFLNAESFLDFFDKIKDWTKIIFGFNTLKLYLKVGDKF